MRERLDRSAGGPARCVRRAGGRRAVALAALVAVLAACGVPTGSEGGGGASASATGRPTVPATGASLGAWLHPDPAGGSGSSFAAELAALPDVVAATGRPLGFLHVYASWARPAPVASLRAVAAAGSTPVLDWGCGPDVGRLASGADDHLVDAYATALRGFGHPVFLRWCWEMNRSGPHALPGGPAGFLRAWDHIRARFVRARASNVAFVWCPALTGADPAPFYPGPAEVDWIGVDGYDRHGTESFADVFGAYYRRWVGQGKPMMVAETGAPGRAQVAYLDSIGTDAPRLPGIKAVGYFDAPGPHGSWQLTPRGVHAFASLAALSYFRAR